MCYNKIMIIEYFKNLINLVKKESVTLKGIYTFTLENIHTGEKRIITKENLVVLTGRAYIILRMMNDQASPGIKLTHAVLGTGIAVPTNADTQLQTEVYRKNVASATSSGNIGYVSAFYTATEVSGTFREAAIFINGTAVVNSGTLFSRVSINIAKTNIETLTVDYQITLN